MKKYLIKTLSAAFAGIFLLASCKKDETKVYFNGGTAPVLNSTVTDSIPLPLSDTTATAVTFSWNNPNFNFSDGISSLNVTYYLEIDTNGANFTSPIMQTISISSALSQTFSVSQFNNILGNQMLLALSQPHNIQVRVGSLLSPYTSNSPLISPLYSNVLNYTVTPYTPPPVVPPPPNDSLYIVGSAVAADNWANPMPAGSISSETFTKVSNTEYKLTIDLVGGGEFKFISQNGSWNNQWSVATADTEPNGGSFVSNGNNCIAPANSGTYVIDVNFQTGKFSVTPK